MRAKPDLADLLKAIRLQLSEALAVTTAAETHAGGGNPERAMKLAFDAEEPVRNANRLLQAAFILSRLQPPPED